MPLFSKKSNKSFNNDVASSNNNSSSNNNNNSAISNNNNNYNHNNNNNNISPTRGNVNKQQNGASVDPTTDALSNVPKPQLIFHCQLAHGSPTGLITGFGSVRELYKKIAECYDIPVEDILFCTLNSHKVDMSKLLGGQIGLDDFIFAHRKGRPKEIEIIKTEDALGLTITDNGAGYAFIKRIKDGSVIARIEHISIGDHIEKLNNISMVGKRHYEVARLLKDIPTGETFTIRLIEPLRSGFSGIGPRSPATSKSNSGRSYGSGKETLRFKANGNVAIEEKFDVTTQAGIEAINGQLEAFMGINDTELASQIWELGAGKTNSMDFAEAVDNSDLESFGFTDDFVIELWGAITDARRRKTAIN